MKLNAATAATMALGASAAGTLNYTDSSTGISFSGYSDGKGYLFGMALPETIGTDVIIQLVAPATDGTGWAGFDFGMEMANKLLLVAWPNGEAVMTSARMATSYATPAVYSGDVDLYPIAAGTYVNSTHYAATFLCAGCITNDDDTFLTTEARPILGWAYSSTAVTDSADASTALNYHSAGFGGFGLTLSDAMSAQYDTWAAMADTTSSTPPVTGGNSTVPGNSTTPITHSNTTYDYIIAGAGPAGLVVAGRLAETGASVLLLERGGASTYSTGGKATVSWNSSVTQYDVPSMAYYLSSAAETTEYCTDTASQAGCILGGGGMVNALMFVAPQDKDFDDKWPAGWKSADVAAASQRFFARNPATDLPSADGQRYDQDAYDVLSSFLSANGFSSVDAINEPNEKIDVFSHPPWNIQNGMRGGPVKTYLPLVENMSNFKLSLNTKMIRAVRNGTWVSGVEVELADGTHQIISVTQTTGKVILAAGALSTPRILFYSGIGPTEQIKTVPSGVTLPDSSEWINLPVGKGVKDHTIITATLGTKSSLTSLASTNFTTPSEESVSLWSEGSGLLTQSGQRLNFWTAVTSPSDGQTRYIQGTCNSPKDNTIRIKLYVTHGVTSSADVVLDTTGKLTQFSGSPWLQTQGDIEAYEVFLDRLVQMTSKANSTLTLQLSDGSAAPSNITGAALFANLKSTSTTGAHFVGTTKMGVDDGRTGNGSAVVDTDTKVYGTDNLFVVDASMHPDLPTGNTQAIVMVAAERAVDKILALTGGSVGSGSGTGTGSGGSGSQPSKCKRTSRASHAKEMLKIRGGIGHQLYTKGLVNRRSDLKDMYGL
ncbi:hypothetical protein JX265_001418 [Neoarthrinium moseri]|uniref:Glucose-methanol-choline oxidoreductase N-terminal domain-containing protein n=1 Tax=Neoarthrinium moseri TaxID=1658444 RepID=A0A9Q0ATS9_9PEZI|nr:hypothetical protein JX265_001418 [Neoarthrinium moseri]